jgi:FixJ family two-component response regulator
MSGPQLVLKIREVLPDLPVVFATGDSDVPEAEGLSKTALITKPYDYEALASLIRGMVAP